MNALRSRFRTFPVLLFASVLALPALAQDTATTFKAIEPEVQTAAWAQSWWMPRHQQKLEEKEKAKQVDLVMIGDSITHGWENAGREVWDKYYAPRHPLNLGFSGDRTEQVLWRLQHGEVEGISPELVVIMIGTNNTGHRQDPAEETAAGVSKIVDELKERLPEAEILILAIFPRGATAEDPLRKLNAAINERLEKLADQEQVHFLDLNDRFLEDDGSLPKSIMPDLLHPNAEGYRIWAEAMEPTISKLMKAE